MKGQLNYLWNRVSRIGLLEHEGLQDLREVIFLNRMLFILPLVILFYVPLEIFFNGFSMLPVVGVMIFCFLLPLPLNYFRLFTFARYYIFFIGNILITGAGLIAGKGINNHVSLIPVVLMSVIIFKKPWERLLALLITIAFFLLQNYLFELVPSQMQLSIDKKEAFSIMFFLLAIVLSYLVGFYFVGINKEYETTVNEQKEAIALKNQEITDSITYAKRIQTAILPSEKAVKECLKNCFILYKPKDIVAGDFYWLERIKFEDLTVSQFEDEKAQVNECNVSNSLDQGIVLFAAADCTGHGVPGAIVSVVCYNALNRSVREFKLREPAKILDKAREIIISEFEKSHEDVKDGMDISLCALNLKTRELQWAGANNPLLIIRNNEIIEVKPDKQPVGKFEINQPFTNHVMQLENQDQIYIFSDGYADQFGGEKGKKLKYKAFKQILLDNHFKPLQDQKTQLDSAIEKWKGKLEQVDDICIIGIRIDTEPV